MNTINAIAKSLQVILDSGFCVQVNFWSNCGDFIHKKILTKFGYKLFFKKHMKAIFY